MKYYEKLIEDHPKYDWDFFASESGRCAGLLCDDCPSSGSCSSLKSVLNKELVMVRGACDLTLECWNNISRKDKVQAHVIFIDENGVAIARDSDNNYMTFRYCCEVSEQRMTNQELSAWLRSGTTLRECKLYDNIVRCTHSYTEATQDHECDSNIRVRENGGEWMHPLKILK